MNRGYIKFWRKAQDSSSWNRGLMYQGLMINLLSRASWKKGSYQGRDILPGQFGVVLGQLAESLSVPKTTLHRMVSHLVEDGFLSVSNMGNRFTIITIINWHLYQEQENPSRNAGGTPVEHQRNAGGTPSYMEEEVKKEEDIKTPPLPPHGGRPATFSASAAGETPCAVPDQASDQPQGHTAKPAKSRRPPSGNSLPELAAAIDAFTPHQALRQALEDYRVMRERIRKPMTGKALELVLRQLTELSGGDEALMVRILEQSIVNSWQGLFALKASGLPGQSRASPAMNSPTASPTVPREASVIYPPSLECALPDPEEERERCRKQQQALPNRRQQVAALCGHP